MAQATGTQILIVDDESSVRAVLRDILESDGYHVSEAVDGQESLDKVSMGGIQLLILDIMMPGISGLDVLKTIRSGSIDAASQQGIDPSVPVILLTAASDDETTWAGWAAGADVFLAKPFDTNNLLRWVERTLPTEPGQAAKPSPTGSNQLTPETEFRGLNE
jgi:CheY-like chemotaxis protein